MTYYDLVNRYRANPTDIHTVPKNREKKWFYIYVKNDKLYVCSAKNHAPKCNISQYRMLNESEFDKMLNLYLRRKRGEAVSYEATQATRNQVYWYGIFADMGV